MSKTRIAELQSLVAKLHVDREAHMDAIAQIDSAFDALGIAMPKGKKRGRKPGKKKTIAQETPRPIATKKKAKKGKRKKYRMTATDLVVATINKAGAKGATGAQISRAWKAAGRSGDAYNTLGIMVKTKKIKRQKLAGGKGSAYRVA